MIVLTGNTMARYPQGGGHWSVRLQYMLGLRALGIEFLWLELFPGGDHRDQDLKLIELFLERFRAHGLDRFCVVARHSSDLSGPSLDDLEVFNMTRRALEDRIERADVLWNFHCSMREPLLSLFRRKALFDLDPGHLQVSALHWEMDIGSHDVFFTVGTNMDQDSCEVPRLGHHWHPFLPPLFLPFWVGSGDPPPEARFSSVTQWNWGTAEEMWLGDRLLNVGKRDAYLKYLDLPARLGSPIELAANIHPLDATGDVELLLSHGWNLVSPHDLSPTPELYRAYLARCRGEFGCPKPIHPDLRTGWFSDRSAAFLGSSRPVVIEETGIGMGLPRNRGILTFESLEEACEKLVACEADYARQAAAAREIAEAFFDSSKILPALLDLCMSESGLADDDFKG